MSYSERLLGKNLTDLTYQDIAEYFQTERDESNSIEYKSYNPAGQFEAKLPGIYKAICGFLNSEGGLVIWGAPAGVRVEGRREKIFHGHVTPLDQNLEKDYLINKLSDNIIPLPRDIKVEILSENENSLIVFEIEKSTLAPHQTNNNYYMRLDGQTRHAPHHYIEALFKQIRYPDLGGYIKFNNLRPTGGGWQLNIEILIMNMSPLVNEEDVKILLTCDRGTLGSSDPTAKLLLNRHQISIENYAKLLHSATVLNSRAVVRLPAAELVEHNYEFKLMLMFGGRHSPMRLSEYSIRVPDVIPDNLNTIVFEIRENAFMHEDAREKGFGTARSINQLLGR